MLAVVYGGWSGLGEGGDWGKVPAAIPVMIFSLVYHDLAPGKDNLVEVLLGLIQQAKECLPVHDAQFYCSTLCLFGW